MLMRPLAAIFLFAAIAAAQPTANTLHVVKASGEATITAKPDQAEISLGVEKNASTAKAAAAQNAAETTRVIDTIKPVLGSAGSIETSQYSITPVYKQKEGGAPVLAGYRAENTVVAKTDNLALTAKILDAATGAGANNIEGIAFTLRNDTAVRARALAQAAQNARANAEAIAGGLNLHVVRVLEAESSQPSIRPLRQFAARSVMARAMPTPIEPASVEVTASVSVTLEVQ
jgi:hypothetical protein